MNLYNTVGVGAKVQIDELRVSQTGLSPGWIAAPRGRKQRTKPISARLIEQVTSSVFWEKSMRHLLAQGFTRFIELGPGTALSGFMKRIDKGAQMLNVADVASLEATVKTLSV